jgi:hypothetical protein
MMKRALIILLVLYTTIKLPLSGQIEKRDVSVQLEKLFGRLLNNFSTETRLQINDSIKNIIDSYAGSDTVFRHRFTKLRYLGQITSPDSLVKIITWNLILDDGANKYFCYLIKRDDTTKDSRVYRLSASYNEAPIRTDTAYSAANWYGALYYSLKPFGFNGQTRYIILGIDYGNSFITRKIIDVLSFLPGGDILFGLNCFTDGKTVKPRVVFEYAATGVMSLKFESENTVVFDHLSPFSPELKDNRQFYGPDFSFDSYTFEKGMWRLKSDIDIRNKE